MNEAEDFNPAQCLQPWLYYFPPQRCYSGAFADRLACFVYLLTFLDALMSPRFFRFIRKLITGNWNPVAMETWKRTEFLRAGMGLSATERFHLKVQHEDVIPYYLPA
jgi:hypothetical protein